MFHLHLLLPGGELLLEGRRIVEGRNGRRHRRRL